MANKKDPICYSTPLEEDIPVNFKVVGTPEWVKNNIKVDELKDGELVQVSDYKELKFLQEFLLISKELAMDSETTGPIEMADDARGYNLNPLNEDTRMLTWQIGNEHISYVIEPALLKELKTELLYKPRVNIFHFALYDFSWLLTKYDIHLDNMYCTMLGEQLLTCGLTGYKMSLQDSVRRRKPYYIISKAIRSSFIRHTGLLDRNMLFYAAKDVHLLIPLKTSQYKLLSKLNLLETAELEFSVIPCTAELQLGGISLDAELLKVIIAYWEYRETIVSKQILDVYNIELSKAGREKEFLIPGLSDNLDLNSNKAKLEAFQKFGFDIGDVKRETLKGIDHDFAKLLVEYSGIAKNVSTYGQNMLNKINKFTNRWHPTFYQLGMGDSDKTGDSSTIATGRFSSDAQQFPRPKDRFMTLENKELKNTIKGLIYAKENIHPNNI